MLDKLLFILMLLCIIGLMVCSLALASNAYQFHRIAVDSQYEMTLLTTCPYPCGESSPNMIKFNELLKHKYSIFFWEN